MFAANLPHDGIKICKEYSVYQTDKNKWPVKGI